jgi:hypothetical protein
VAALLGKGGKKNTPRSEAQVWRFFLSRLLYPCKYVFVEQRKRLTNTYLPALFFLQDFRLRSA